MKPLSPAEIEALDALEKAHTLAYDVSMNLTGFDQPTLLTRCTEVMALADKAISNIRTALARAQSARVPEGMVMVPVEPTEEMIVAMGDCLLKTFNTVTREEIIAGHHAMLAAAPNAEKEGKS